MRCDKGATVRVVVADALDANTIARPLGPVAVFAASNFPPELLPDVFR